jgi:hypothetical protein
MGATAVESLTSELLSRIRWGPGKCCSAAFVQNGYPSVSSGTKSASGSYSQGPFNEPLAKLPSVLFCVLETSYGVEQFPAMDRSCQSDMNSQADIPKFHDL